MSGSIQNRLCFTSELAAYLAAVDAPIIVTGAGGWLGRATLEMLDAALGDKLHHKVYAFSNSTKTISLRSGKQISSRNLKTLDEINIPPATIFHYAFLTREHALSQSLAEYVKANGEITRIIYDFVMRNGASGMFIPSSGAVYGKERRIQNDLHLNPYSALKFEDEIKFQNLAERLGFPCAILRVFNLAGPFMNKLSSYVLASIICDIASGGPIVLRADKKVMRSYAYVGDVINLAAAIIHRQISIAPFDTAGDRIVEIGELASIVVQVVADRPIQIIRPDISYAEKDFYCGEGTTYFRLAKTIGLNLMPLDDQISATADYLRSMQ